MPEQVFCDFPAAVDCADDIGLGDSDIVEVVSQNGDAPEISLMGRVVTPSLSMSTEEGDPVIFVAGLGADQAENPVRRVRRSSSRPSGRSRGNGRPGPPPWSQGSPGPSRHGFGIAPWHQRILPGQCREGIHASVPRCHISTARGPSIESPNDFKGHLQPSALISSCKILAWTRKDRHLHIPWPLRRRSSRAGHDLHPGLLRRRTKTRDFALPANVPSPRIGSRISGRTIGDQPVTNFASQAGMWVAFSIEPSPRDGHSRELREMRRSGMLRAYPPARNDRIETLQSAAEHRTAGPGRHP